MKRLSITFCLIILNFSGLIYGQSNVMPDFNEYSRQFSLSNPDVYSFEKYSFSPVTNYVGKQSVNVPIYTIESGGINYPIKLNYATGGIKVDQLASDVGLGWSLSQAIITRTIIHENDFDNLGARNLRPDYNLYTTSEKNADSDARYDYNSEYKVGYFLQKRDNIQITPNSQYVDFMPDIYSFYIDGFSTSFFFNDENTPVEINPKGTKIEAIASTQRFDVGRVNYMGNVEVTIPTRDFFTIIITTNEGIKYTFSDCDLSLNQVVGGRTTASSFELAHSPAQISAWHVTKIEDLKTGKKIDFVYENSSSNPNQGMPNTTIIQKYAQRSFELDEDPSTNSPGNCSYYVPYSGYETFDKKIIARIDVQKKRLRKILFDEGQVFFNYNQEGIASQWGVGRNDLYNGDFLTQVYLKDKNFKAIKSFDLKYSTFNSDYNVGEFNPDGELNTYRYKRLKLLSFEEVGMPPYKFSYEESIKLPPVNSFSVDFLGYFNNS
ncbi:hypothetical protein NAT51_03925 [Flavobacterium amniphilum]|uniref:hypothetical protein n=1 Tax=Flavobacterium amniphilum TaxID=1834035 RepID=UPI00202A7160|nr:hypothetical protein [Flavobacterium amniphilum]MCL9804655.1 hypothetical protein [Flavobacterium amniphilum]